MKPTSASTTGSSRLRLRRRDGSRNARRGTVPVRGLLPLAVLLLIWQLTGGSEPNFPPPSDWWSSIATLQDEGSLVPAIGQTLKSFVISLVIATVIGSLLGFLVGQSRITDRMLGPTLEFLRFTPAAAIIPVVVLLVGYEEKTKVIVVVLGSVWPILLQMRQASRSLSQESHDLARSLRLSPRQRVMKIQAPILLPSIVLGVRVAAPLCLILVLLVEITTSVPGLGNLMAHAQQNFLTPQVYGLVVVAVVLSYLINIAIGMLANYTARYQPR